MATSIKKLDCNRISEPRGKTCDMLLAGGLDCPHKAVSQEHPPVEREILSPAGDRLLNIRVSGLKDASGRVCGFVHVIRNVTRERDLERQMVKDMAEQSR